jgi:hypothetical protein
MPKLFTVRQFAENNPAFSEASLRWQIFNADKNGLEKSGVILRNGRRILIDGDKYFSWLQSQQRHVA